MNNEPQRDFEACESKFSVLGAILGKTTVHERCSRMSRMHTVSRMSCATPQTSGYVSVYECDEYDTERCRIPSVLLSFKHYRMYPYRMFVLFQKTKAHIMNKHVLHNKHTITCDHFVYSLNGQQPLASDLLTFRMTG